MNWIPLPSLSLSGPRELSDWSRLWPLFPGVIFLNMKKKPNKPTRALTTKFLFRQVPGADILLPNNILT